MSSISTKLPSPFSAGSPDDWEYVAERGKYRNRFTGQFAEEPDSDIPAFGTLSVAAEEEEGFTISEAQYRAGVRLAISERSGLVRRCPTCRRRRLLVVPKEGAKFLTCAGNFVYDDADVEREGSVTSSDSVVSSADACDFERKVS